MKEVGVRKFHRSLGIIVVWFLAAQALTGLILSIAHMGAGHHSTTLLVLSSTFHFGWNPLGGVYRTLLALAVLAQGISGIIIYYMIRARTPKT